MIRSTFNFAAVGILSFSFNFAFAVAIIWAVV